MEQNQIHQFYEWIKVLAKKDSVDFDFHGFQEEKTKVSFQKQRLKNCSCSSSRHLNLRVLQGEKAGASYTKDFSRSSLEDCYRQAFNSLKLSDKKERGDLSKNETYQDFSDFCNEELKKISIEDKIKKAKEMNKACLSFDKRIQPVSSSVSDSEKFVFFANSAGSQSFYRTNDVFSSCYSLAIAKDSRSNGFSEKGSRVYQDIDFKKIGKEAASKALKKLNYSIPKTKKYPVVFKSGQASASLLSALSALMSGKTVFDGLSLFKDSLGKRVFSEAFHLYDDPFALWGGYSKPFDGEGFSTEKTSLVEKGVLKNYLTSSFFARTLKVPHTKKSGLAGGHKFPGGVFNKPCDV